MNDIDSYLEIQSIESQIQVLLEKLKSKHITAWAFIQVLIARIEDYSFQIKEGWGYATLAAETVSEDIANLKDDVTKMESEAKNGKVSKETAAKFKEDFEKYKKDVNDFKSYYTTGGHKYPSPTVADTLKKLEGNIKLIEDTKYDGKTIGELLSSGSIDDLDKALSSLAKEDKTTGTIPMDEWMDGASTIGAFYMGGSEALNEDEQHIIEAYNEMKNAKTPAEKEAAAKRFALAYQQYKGDLDIYKSTVPTPSDVANYEDNFNLIKNTKTSSGKTLGELIDQYNKTGSVKDLNNLEDGITDCVNNDKLSVWEGGTPQTGLKELYTVTDGLQTEGQRELNTYNTKINTFNNVASNAVKSWTDMFSNAVKNQTVQ